MKVYILDALVYRQIVEGTKAEQDPTKLSDKEFISNRCDELTLEEFQEQYNGGNEYSVDSRYFIRFIEEDYLKGQLTAYKDMDEYNRRYLRELREDFSEAMRKLNSFANKYNI